MWQRGAVSVSETEDASSTVEMEHHNGEKKTFKISFNEGEFNWPEAFEAPGSITLSVF